MKPPKDYVKLQHDGNARHRDGQVEHPSDVYPILEAIEEMEERIDEPPTSVLVVGCRTGYELTQLKNGEVQFSLTCTIYLSPETSSTGPSASEPSNTHTTLDDALRNFYGSRDEPST
jgi:hypothetical protein